MARVLTWLTVVALVSAAVAASASASAANSVVTELVSPWAETPLLLEGLELYAQHAATPAAFWDFLTSVRGTCKRHPCPPLWLCIAAAVAVRKCRLVRVVSYDALPALAVWTPGRLSDVPTFAAQLVAVTTRSGSQNPTDRDVYNALVSASSAHLAPLTAEAYKVFFLISYTKSILNAHTHTLAQVGLHGRVAAPAVVAALQIAREQVAGIVPACAAAGAPFVVLAGAATCTVFQIDKLRLAGHAALTVYGGHC
jgi:hypothetical protein